MQVDNVDFDVRDSLDDPCHGLCVCAYTYVLLMHTPAQHLGFFGTCDSQSPNEEAYGGNEGVAWHCGATKHAKDRTEQTKPRGRVNR